MAKEFAVSCVEGCVVIQMRWGENRLNPDFISAMNSALDKAERLTIHTHTHTHTHRYMRYELAHHTYHKYPTT